MSDINLTRRGFIRGIATTAAGVSFTLTLASCSMGLGEDDDSTSGIDLLSWVIIQPDNTVVLRVPQTELGQGVSTTIPQMLAEELELDWEQVKVEPYSPAENQARDNVFVWTTTLGSLSAHYLYEPTQQAEAQIRMMLIDVAAQQLGLGPDELTASASHVVNMATGDRIPYADLAEEAAQKTPPEPASIVFKEPSSRSFVGKSVERRDLRELTTGQKDFGIDFELPGMRFVAIKQSPTFGGSLINYDAGSIAGMAGDPEIVKVEGAHVGYNSPVPEGEDPDLWAAPVHMDDAVAVVADSWWQAKSALDRLAIDWDAGDHADFSSATYFETMAELAQGDIPTVAETGNVDAAMAEAAQRISSEYRYPFMEPAPLEPMNCSALVEDGEVHLWTNSQFPDDAWRIAYELAGVSPEKAILHLQDAGGGFGRRLQNDFVHQVIQIAMAMPGTPVKLIQSREESLRRSYYAPLTVAQFDGGLDGQGNVTCWSCSVASSMAAEQSYGAVRFPFRPENTRFRYKRDMESPVPFGWMRGVGFTQHLWMNFSFLDELRQASGQDPVSFYRGLLDPDHIPQDLEGRELAVGRAERNRRLLDHAVQNGGWNAPKHRGTGRGIAASDSDYYAGYGSSTKAAIVDVSFGVDGLLSIDRVYVAIDAGTVINPDIVHGQLEGGIAYALTTALLSEITIENGQVRQSNFHDYPILKMDRMPTVQIDVLESGEAPTSVGEDSIPITIAALINAIADAGGPRIRQLPFGDLRIARS